ncbi:MAG: DUF1049 domain-containing protein [Microcoleus sp. SIO2G3]|nr:DUF1049 domain-containing protein [Microcoleus sp. SIO2G3]
MKTIANLLTSIILAGWLGAIAILAIQNFTPITVKFLAFESIQVPVGIVLAFSVGTGLIMGALVPALWQLAGQQVQYEDED